MSFPDDFVKKCMLLGAGGALGSISRFYLSTWIHSQIGYAFPWGVFAVNFLGCFLAGIVAGLMDLRSIDLNWALFLNLGFLGAFTTYSAYEFYSFMLIKAGLYQAALFNSFGAMILCYGGLWFGFVLAQVVVKAFRAA